MKNLFLYSASAALLLGAGTSGAADPDFEKDILPIFEDRCMSCHRAPYTDARGRTKKPKGELRMDAKEEIAKGGESGDAVKAKDLDKSLVYARVILDEDDDDVMPPKDGTLTKDQIELIKKWIEAGADYGKWEKTEFDDEGKPKK